MNFNLSDNIVARGLSRIFDMVVLNIIFVIVSIPIITIGASITAMYAVMLKMVKNEEGYIVKGFLLAFKENFKMSTRAWMIMLPLSMIIFINIRLSAEMPALSSVFMVFFIIVGVVVVFTSVYVFPLIARYENTLKATFKNAFLLAIGKLPYTVLLVLLHVVPLFITLFDVQTFVFGILIWLTIGFALVSWCCSKILRRVFVIFEDLEAEKEEE
jgi:uncharacterized membrane protein YesL